MANKDPMKFFATPRAVTFHVNFRDHEGYAGTFTASASWREDGDQMAIGFGLKEFPLTLDEMIACRDALNMAISARRESDAACAVAE